MKKKFTLFAIPWIAFGIVFSSFAEIPAGYYEQAVGKSSQSLKTALFNIISNCGSVSYDGLYSVYKTSDVRPDGKVWDMYSATTNFSFSQTCGNYKNEGDCYNREHSVPQSWFNERPPMKSDAWHVYPTDGKVNGMRSNYPFGEVGNASYTSNQGFSKVGTCSTAGYSGKVFEPNDEYKGDFARAYFYFATRYQDRITNWGNIFTSTYPNITKWQMDMLLKWHRQDPVSQKETDRNEAVYKSNQRNRNPFIDYPELAELIFGSRQGEEFYPGSTQDAYLVEPLPHSTFSVGSAPVGSQIGKRLSIKGKNIENPVHIALSGTNASSFSIDTESITAAQANEGYGLTVTFTPASPETLTAQLSISGDDITTVNVTLNGTGIDGFAAIEAGNITQNSFTANWTAKNDATDYEIVVYTLEEGGGGEANVILYEDFKEDVNWTVTGYAVVEPKEGGLRLASSNKGGSVVTPPLDLSGDHITLYLKSKPYRTDASKLTIMLDNQPLGTISYAGQSIEKTFPVTGGKTDSRISFSADAKKRVVLEELVISSGTKVEKINVAGYPRRTGNTTSYEVTGLENETTYYYTVTPVVNGQKGEPSNEVTVTTRPSSSSVIESVTEENLILIYSSENRIYVVNAPANARMEVYSLSGQLVKSAVLRNSEIEEKKIASPGLYIVRVTTPSGTRTEKVLIE